MYTDLYLYSYTHTPERGREEEREREREREREGERGRERENIIHTSILLKFMGCLNREARKVCGWVEGGPGNSRFLS